MKQHSVNDFNLGELSKDIEEAYDKLVEAINKPPEYNEKIARVLSKPSPWNEENEPL